MRQVAVVGPGDGASAEQVERARRAGELLARAGAVVLTGGLAGVMAGAAAGAAAAGGVRVALLPGHDAAAAVGSYDVVVPTGLGELRDGLLVRAADAVLCVGWSWGTLAEVALAARSGVPVVSLVDLALPPPVRVEVDLPAAVALVLGAPG